MRRAFSETYKLVAGQTSPEDALANGNYPASGSYVDVSGYETVDIVIHLGALTSAVVFTVKQTDATNGATLDTISTANCVHTIATDDDDECVTFHLETANLADDHHFITVVVSSAAGSDDYADIMYYLGGARHLPVTQTTALLPSASQNIHAG